MFTGDHLLQVSVFKSQLLFDQVHVFDKLFVMNKRRVEWMTDQRPPLLFLTLDADVFSLPSSSSSSHRSLS